MNIFVSNQSLAWRSWLSSYGFSYTEDSVDFKNIDTFIEPEYNLVKRIMSLGSRCVIVSSDDKLIKGLGINDIDWKDNYLDRTNFDAEKVYLPSAASFVIRCGRVGSIDFITYKLNLNKCLNASNYKA